MRADPAVRFVGSPDDEELARLYRGATALAYPSRMEGFGLPVAEAMASGIPVAASDLACIREFAGEAPLYTPPGDANALAGSLFTLVTRPDERNARRAAGLKQAAVLDWTTVGRRHAELLEAVVRK
jgi:glycosyltransferase involved in cell wall biosynthesis